LQHIVRRRLEKSGAAIVQPWVEIRAFEGLPHAIIYLGSDGVGLGDDHVQDLSFSPVVRSFHSSQRPAKAIGSPSVLVK